MHRQMDIWRKDPQSNKDIGWIQTSKPVVQYRKWCHVENSSLLWILCIHYIFLIPEKLGYLKKKTFTYKIRVSISEGGGMGAAPTPCPPPI